MGTMSSHPQPQRSPVRPPLPSRPPSQPLRQPKLSPPSAASFPLTPSISPHPSPTRTTVHSSSAPVSAASSAFSSPSSSASSSPLPAASAPCELLTCSRIRYGGQLRYQQCWECLDCQLTNELLVCAFCKEACHAGHRIVLKGLGWHAGVCDCSSDGGRQKQRRCRAPTARQQPPLPMQRAPSAPGQRRIVSLSQLQPSALRGPPPAGATAACALPGPPRMVSAQTLPTRPASMSTGFPAHHAAFSPPPLSLLAAGRLSPAGPGMELEAFNSVSAMSDFKQPQPLRSSLSAVAIPTPSFAGRASSQPALLPPPLPLQSERPARSVPVLEDVGGLEPPEPEPTRSFVKLGEQTHEVRAAAPPAAPLQHTPQLATRQWSCEEEQRTLATGETQSGEGGEPGEGCGEEGQTEEEEEEEGDEQEEEDEKEEEGESNSAQEGQSGTSSGTRNDDAEQQVEGRPNPRSQAHEGETTSAAATGCVVLMHAAVLSEEAPLPSRSSSTPQPHCSNPPSRLLNAPVSALSAATLSIALPSTSSARAAFSASSLFPSPSYSLAAGPPALDRTTSLPALPSNVDLSDVIRRHYPSLYAKLPPEAWQPLSAHRLTEAPGEAPDEAPLQQSGQCRRCLQHEATVCMLPCGHRCLCGECIWSFRMGMPCPVCRCSAQDMQRAERG